MIGSLRQRPFGSPFRRRINRGPSPVLALAMPWLTVMLGSLSPLLPLVASAPVLPPFGFLILLAWRQLRPGLIPVWAGLPLGFVDDLFSGQPLGSATLLWSIALIAFDAVEARFPWRNFIINWLEAAALIASYLALSLIIANAAGGNAHIMVIVPQLTTSALVFPLVGRFVAACDRARLWPIRIIG